MPSYRFKPRSLAAKIRTILAVRGLTLSQVSRASRSLAPANALQYIPHNLYSALRRRSFSPNVYQVFAFSVLTGYRFADWLAVFGFSLREVTRFQVGFPTVRTVELDASIWRPEDELPWFDENHVPDFDASLMPLGSWLGLHSPALFQTRTKVNSKHRYAKIRSQDAFAYPELVPGSIIRVTSTRIPTVIRPLGTKQNNKLYLIAHRKGLLCAQLARSEAGKFVLCSRQLPYAPVELEEQRDAIILGFADLEIRPLERLEQPVVTRARGRFWTRGNLAPYFVVP
jgi:hypothetical protein